MNDIYADVVERLGMLGVDVAPEGDSGVRYAIGRAKERILNDINHPVVPFGLRYTFIDLAAGYYLQDQKDMGLLDPVQFDFSAAPAKQIKEGDVQITFASASEGSMTPEARFDRLVQALTTPNPTLLARYRRLVW